MNKKNNELNPKILFLGLSSEVLLEYLKNIAEFCRNHMDAILNCSILLSCLFIYLNIPKVIKLIYKNNVESEEKKRKWIKRVKIIYWFLFIFILTYFILFDYIWPESFPLPFESYVCRRTLKFGLAFILSISLIYINTNTYGYKSWRTWLSFTSLIITTFLAFVYYNDNFSHNVSNLIHDLTCLVIVVISICGQGEMLHHMDINVPKLPNYNTNPLEKERLVSSMKSHNSTQTKINVNSGTSTRNERPNKNLSWREDRKKFNSNKREMLLNKNIDKNRNRIIGHRNSWEYRDIIHNIKNRRIENNFEIRRKYAKNIQKYFLYKDSKGNKRFFSSDLRMDKKGNLRIKGKLITKGDFELFARNNSIEFKKSKNILNIFKNKNYSYIPKSKSVNDITEIQVQTPDIIDKDMIIENTIKLQEAQKALLEMYNKQMKAFETLPKINYTEAFVEQIKKYNREIEGILGDKAKKTNIPKYLNPYDYLSKEVLKENADLKQMKWSDPRPLPHKPVSQEEWFEGGFGDVWSKEKDREEAIRRGEPEPLENDKANKDEKNVHLRSKEDVVADFDRAEIKNRKGKRIIRFDNEMKTRKITIPGEYKTQPDHWKIGLFKISDLKNLYAFFSNRPQLWWDFKNAEELDFYNDAEVRHEYGKALKRRIALSRNELPEEFEIPSIMKVSYIRALEDAIMDKENPLNEEAKGILFKEIKRAQAVPDPEPWEKDYEEIYRDIVLKMTGRRIPYEPESFKTILQRIWKERRDTLYPHIREKERAELDAKLYQWPPKLENISNYPLLSDNSGDLPLGTGSKADEDEKYYNPYLLNVALNTPGRLEGQQVIDSLYYSILEKMKNSTRQIQLEVYNKEARMLLKSKLVNTEYCIKNDVSSGLRSQAEAEVKYYDERYYNWKKELADLDIKYQEFVNFISLIDRHKEGILLRQRTFISPKKNLETSYDDLIFNMNKWSDKVKDSSVFQNKVADDANNFIRRYEKQMLLKGDMDRTTWETVEIVKAFLNLQKDNKSINLNPYRGKLREPGTFQMIDVINDVLFKKEFTKKNIHLYWLLTFSKYSCKVATDLL